MPSQNINIPLPFSILASGSESPAPFVEKSNPLSTSLKAEGERYRQLSKMLITNTTMGEKGSENQQLSNEISAPYEVPQYPIEQIETKLIRLVAIH